MLAADLDPEVAPKKIDATAAYINNQLQSLGFPAPFDFNSGKDLPRILACIYSLLQQRQVLGINKRRIHTLDTIYKDVMNSLKLKMHRCYNQ
jgi:hypothetical protein